MTLDSKSPALALLAALALVTLIALVHLLSHPQAVPIPAPLSDIQASNGPAEFTTPLAFVPNHGQTDGKVRYEARRPGLAVYLARDKAVFAFGHGQKAHALHMRFVGSSPDAKLEPGHRLAGRVNYLHSSDPASWQRGLPTYGEVAYRDLWPGIDLILRGSTSRLKYEFVVHPGAKVGDIRLDYQGATGLAVANSGALSIDTPAGALKDSRPRSYQRRGGRKADVESNFALRGGTAYGFQVGTYDRSRALVIDPGLAYSTFLGGSRHDEVAADVAVDLAGNAYVFGGTFSTDYPTTPGAIDTSYNGFGDVFVTKLDSSGSKLVYSTFLGGASRDSSGFVRTGGISVDNTGNAYITGATDSDDFPTTPGSFDRQKAPGLFEDDAFVAKLDPSGSGLVYSTFLGGAQGDRGNDVFVDARGQAYVTGETKGGIPTTPGAFDTQREPHFSNTHDAFLTKLNASGSDLVYSTYLEGAPPSDDAGMGIAVDGGGNAFVAGSTEGGFPTTLGAFDRTLDAQNPSDGDGFVAKLNPDGSGLVFSTYLGGSDGEAIRDIAIDAEGDAYVTGETESADFPTTPFAFDRTRAGSRPPDLVIPLDAFVTKLNPAGSDLVYSTYLGGLESDGAFAIAIDRHGSAYVSGRTRSSDFPATGEAFDNTYNGPYPQFPSFPDGDAFASQLDPAGSILLYSTYLGSGDNDAATGLALDQRGGLYVTGITQGSDFPTTPVSYQPDIAGSVDSFVTKLIVGNTPCRIVGNGHLSSNRSARFHVNVRFDGDAPASNSQLFYNDKTAALSFRSSSLISVIGAGSQATIRGSGQVGFEPVTFEVELVAGKNKSPGSFSIALSNGYQLAGPVRDGVLKVECPEGAVF